MSYWNQKNVVVAGGSSGFGKILARTLAGLNANVIVLGRNQQRLDSTVNELGNQVTAFSADANSSESLQEALAAIGASHKELHAVFNCIGQSTRQCVLDLEPANLQPFIETNLYTAINLTNCFLPRLCESRGHLVHIGSLASKTAWPFVAPYAISKSSLGVYVQQLRLEGPSEVHYLLVCPGPIRRTDANSRYSDQSKDLPDGANKPAAGAKLKGIDPELLATKILRASQKRKRELIVPTYARIAFIASAISPRLGDWILKKKMSK